MITPLRRRHRWLAPGAFALALAVLGAALAARPDAHVARMRPEPRGSGAAVTGGDALFAFVSDAHDYKLELLGADGQRPRRLRLVPRFTGRRRPIDAPDLLLYATSEAPDGDALPAGAEFLGAASTTDPTEVALPGVGPRRVVLYSLGHARVVEAVEVPGEGGR